MTTMTGKLRRHGSEQNYKKTVPDFGEESLIGHAARIDRVPVMDFEVAFTAPEDCVTIATGPVSGEYKLDTDKLREIRVEPYRLNFHPAGSSTFARSHKMGGELFVFVLNSDLRKEMVGSRPQCIDTEAITLGIQSRNAVSLTQKVRKLFLQSRSYGRLAADAMSILLLSELLGGQDKERADASAEVAAALEFINDCPDRPFSLLHLSEMCQLSPPVFYSTFRLATGLAPHEYLRDRRLTLSMAMLRKQKSAESVAHAVGFEDLEEMNQVFQDAISLSAIEYLAEFDGPKESIRLQ